MSPSYEFLDEAARTLAVAHWTRLLDALPIPAALIDADGRTVHANRWLDVDAGDQLVESDNEAAPGVLTGVDGDTSWRVRQLSTDGAIMIATHEDEDAGDHLARRFFSIGESLYVVYDQWGRIIECNAAWEELLGYPTEQVYGLDSWELLPPGRLDMQRSVEAELRTEGRSEPILPMRTASGEYRTIKWALHFDASLGRCFGLGRDITSELGLQAELERRAFTDELTGLANRAALLESLERALEGDTTPAVLFCDLNRFKIINDSLGHLRGDKLLADLGQRLNDLAIADDSLVARIGGDEFVILLGNSDPRRAIQAAEATLDALRAPFQLAGRQVHVSMSIGIAVADADRHYTAASLLAEADTAAYEAKREQSNSWVMFDRLMQARVDRRFNVENDVRDALEEGRMEVHFQPFVEASTGEIVGAEALVRMRRADGTLAGPGEFLDVAEDAGLLPQLGQRVVETTMLCATDLAERGLDMMISMNVSGVELNSPDFAESVIAHASDHGTSLESIVLEITESAVLHVDYALPVLHSLREAGMRIALDDFGTGFSSLAHLRELPIDMVKVDRTFVRDLDSDAVTRKVTGSLIGLCAALGLDVVMEGVETEAQLAAVEAAGASLVQGYYLYRPMPFDHLLHIIGSRTGAHRVPA